MLVALRRRQRMRGFGCRGECEEKVIRRDTKRSFVDTAAAAFPVEIFPRLTKVLHRTAQPIEIDAPCSNRRDLRNHQSPDTLGDKLTVGDHSDTARVVGQETGWLSYSFDRRKRPIDHAIQDAPLVGTISLRSRSRCIKYLTRPEVVDLDITDRNRIPTVTNITERHNAVRRQKRA